MIKRDNLKHYVYEMCSFTYLKNVDLREKCSFILLKKCWFALRSLFLWIGEEVFLDTNVSRTFKKTMVKTQTQTLVLQIQLKV